MLRCYEVCFAFKMFPRSSYIYRLPDRATISYYFLFTIIIYYIFVIIYYWLHRMLYGFAASNVLCFQLT